MQQRHAMATPMDGVDALMAMFAVPINHRRQTADNTHITTFVVWSFFFSGTHRHVVTPLMVEYIISSPGGHLSLQVETSIQGSQTQYNSVYPVGRQNVLPTLPTTVPYSSNAITVRAAFHSELVLPLCHVLMTTNQLSSSSCKSANKCSVTHGSAYFELILIGARAPRG